ncbi:MAG: hypothetical protein ACI8X3_003104, partial [Saprospiraceae bacterium]
EAVSSDMIGIYPLFFTPETGGHGCLFRHLTMLLRI